MINIIKPHSHIARQRVNARQVAINYMQFACRWRNTLSVWQWWRRSAYHFQSTCPNKLY